MSPIIYVDGHQKKIKKAKPKSPKENKMGKKRHKTTFSDLIVARSGFSNDKGNIFVTLKNGAGDPLCTHIRRVPLNRKSSHHQEMFGERHKSITNLWNRLSVNFVSDLKRYAHAFNLRYRRDDHPMSAFNIFVKVLSRQTNSIPTLLTLSQSLGNTIDEWMVNGFLPRVNVSQPFDATII